MGMAPDRVSLGEEWDFCDESGEVFKGRIVALYEFEGEEGAYYADVQLLAPGRENEIVSVQLFGMAGTDGTLYELNVGSSSGLPSGSVH